MKQNQSNTQELKSPNDRTERPALKPAAISNQNIEPVRSSDLVRPQSIVEILNMTKEEIKERSESTARWLTQAGIDPSNVPIVNLYPNFKV